jgi:hypothetical protein
VPNPEKGELHVNPHLAGIRRERVIRRGALAVDGALSRLNKAEEKESGHRELCHGTISSWSRGQCQMSGALRLLRVAHELAISTG